MGTVWSRTLHCTLFLACILCPLLAFSASSWDSRSIRGPLFDANHCLQGVRLSSETETVEFLWACGESRLITMSCVFDLAGYRAFGSERPPPGWHCNRPLPVLKDGIGARISDVAVRSADRRVVWAACFVDDYGEPNVREKPYHDTACYRAMMTVQREVNETQRDPVKIAAEHRLHW